MSGPSRPVSGFVPLGDLAGAVELPDGRVLSPGAATSQARHHFTTLRQVDQLIEASEADADLGFMARLLALCSLPRTNPKTRLQYVRRNGPYTLTMTASSAGVKLPFGTLPRLLLAWVCSEAVRTQRRDLVLGRSLYEFMHKLGLDDQGGGERGNRVRLKNQMERLFSCSVSLVYADAWHKVQVQSFIADRAEYWWDVSRPDAPVLWNSTIELGEKFFLEIIAHPIPIDMNTLRAMKRSSLGLDLYLWLTYRTFTLRVPITLTWRQLFRQFGADPEKAGKKGSVSRFRGEVLRELKKSSARGRTCTITRSRARLSSCPRRRASHRHSSVSSATRPARRVFAARLPRAGRSASW